MMHTRATLLLSHSPDQTITQKRIEAFIGAMPSLHETEDPKSILQRQKISEIYILHVLPRVGEWEYAKEFTQFSPDIDEEQKEAFYSTLDQLKKDMEAAELHSQELALQREAELAYEAALALEDSPPPSTARSNRSVSRRREPSTTGRTRAPSVRPGTARASSTVRGEISPKRGAATAERKTKRQASVSQHKDAAAVTRKATTVKTGQPRGQSSMIRGLSGMLQKLHQGVVGNGPLALLRALLMIAMVAWMGSNKKVRERIRKVIMICWVKVARTVGMGMKVTYV